MNNLAKLGYCSVVIMNMFPSLEGKKTNGTATKNLRFVSRSYKGR